MVLSEEVGPNQIQELWQQFVHTSLNLEHDIAQISKIVGLDDWLNIHE
jgi:DNA mismatch repair protein MutL